jgi:hypothetical protein
MAVVAAVALLALVLDERAVLSVALAAVAVFLAAALIRAELLARVLLTTEIGVVGSVGCSLSSLLT